MNWTSNKDSRIPFFKILRILLCACQINARAKFQSSLSLFFLELFIDYISSSWEGVTRRFSISVYAYGYGCYVFYLPFFKIKLYAQQWFFLHLFVSKYCGLSFISKYSFLAGWRESTWFVRGSRFQRGEYCNTRSQFASVSVGCLWHLYKFNLKISMLGN